MFFTNEEAIDPLEWEWVKRDAASASVILKFIGNQAKKAMEKMRTSDKETLVLLQAQTQVLSRLHDELEAFVYPKK